MALGKPLVLATPMGAALIALLAAAVLLHAWVGVRDVVLDYLHPLGLRLAVLVATAAALFFLGLSTALILVTRAL